MKLIHIINSSRFFFFFFQNSIETECKSEQVATVHDVLDKHSWQQFNNIEKWIVWFFVFVFVFGFETAAISAKKIFHIAGLHNECESDKSMRMRAHQCIHSNISKEEFQ